MRAATAIVAAIAAASILIASAFILSGGGDTTRTATKTVTEIVHAPEPKAEVASEASGSGKASFGGPAVCNGGEFTVEDVSCEVGAQIHEQFEQGGSTELLAEDQEAGETITMSCSKGTSPITCTGPGGAKVYFGE
jgi:hypothetical protein